MLPFKLRYLGLKCLPDNRWVVVRPAEQFEPITWVFTF